MANALYGKGREGFLDGSIDWDTNTIKVFLIDTSAYAVTIDTDNDLADIATAAAFIATSPALASKTVTLGVADAADATLASVSGSVSEALVIAQSSGTPANDRLIAYIDSATGLPVTPNGGNIVIQWDSGTSKIFKL